MINYYNKKITDLQKPAYLVLFTALLEFSFLLKLISRLAAGVFTNL